MSPVKRQQMRDWKCFWNRYQTKHDLTIGFICNQLRKAHLIHSYFIDKWHVTNVLTTQNSFPVPITNFEDFVDIFTPDVYTKVNAILHQHLPDHSLPQEEEPLAVTAESGPAAEEGAPPAVVATAAGKAVIDATENIDDMDDTPA